jgi:hypothetical protein
MVTGYEEIFTNFTNNRESTKQDFGSSVVTKKVDVLRTREQILALEEAEMDQIAFIAVTLVLGYTIICVLIDIFKN